MRQVREEQPPRGEQDAGVITAQDVLEPERDREAHQPSEQSAEEEDLYPDAVALTEEEHAEERRSKGPPGFYLRISGGPALGWARTENGTIGARTWGSGVMANIGMTLVPGLSLHGDLVFSQMFAYEADSNDRDFDVMPDDVDLGMYTVGVGATYEWQPIGLFAGIGAGVAGGRAVSFDNRIGPSGELETTVSNADLGTGVGLHASFGKLFPVNDRWSLGLSGHYAFRYFSDEYQYRLDFRTTHATWLSFVAAYAP